MKEWKLNEKLTLVANFSVVVGIIFLVVELQQNTEAVKLGAAQFMASEQASLNRHWMDPNLADAYVQNATQGFDSLTPVQKRIWYGFTTSYLQIQQVLFYQWQSGSLEQGVWNGRHRQLVDLFRRDQFRYTWSIWGIGASDEFRDYINNVVIPEGEKLGK